MPDDVETIKGSDVNFACKVTGKPSPKITWFKDAKTIKKDKNVALETKEDEDNLVVESDVKLTNVAPVSSEGKYTVEASNLAGSVTHEVDLIGKNTYGHIYTNCENISFGPSTDNH